MGSAAIAVGEQRIVPVVLAGGSGTRLWPLSRSAFPKHLVELLGDSSLLQATVKRVLRVAPAQRVVTVAAAGHAILVRRQLGTLHPALLDNLLLEPEPRNTAAAVALAAHQVRRRFGDEAVMWVCPSDHLILDDDTLVAAAQRGAAAAATGRLVTFGITPSRPDTGFGWIAADGSTEVDGVLPVREFVEKPDRERAEAMLAAGGYLWNSGMFLFRPDVLLAEMAEYEPEVASGVERAFAGLRPGVEPIPDPAIFSLIKSTPIDKAVMERSRKVAVVPCDPRWSDVGSWRALFDLLPKDEGGNAVSGDTVLADATANFVRAEHRLVALAGVSNLAVVETPDAVFVGELGKDEAIRGIVAQLNKAQRRQADVHAREHRPWGTFCTLASGAGFRVREVVVEPQARMGRQRHASRDKQWIVVSGRARVEIEGGTRELLPSQATAVPRGSVHRLANAGTTELRIIEVALGDVVTDEATERFPD